MSFDSLLTDKSAYWDTFYAKDAGRLNVPRYPSQFAAFVANELATRGSPGLMVEFGCGNGRDSEFFANCGFSVVAMDASASAIDACIASTAGSRVTYLRKDVSEARDCLNEVLRHPVRFPSIAVYARFFLHAITPKEQERFLEMLGDELPPNALVFFEYRTDGDKLDCKEFGSHYRRFQPHRRLLDALISGGFSIDYEIEGRGLAKYKAEDAVVGRCVARQLP